MNLNKVLIAGNLTRDPELRYTSTGRPVCTFSIAVNRRYQGNDGQKKEETTFVRCTAWGPQGESVAAHLGKGAGACVEGRLHLNQWEDKDGGKRSTLEVVADFVHFLGKKSSGGGHDEPPPPTDEDIPY